MTDVGKALITAGLLLAALALALPVAGVLDVRRRWRGWRLRRRFAEVYRRLERPSKLHNPAQSNGRLPME